MKRIFIFLFLILLFFSQQLYAQETSETSDKENEKKERDFKTLVQDTLENDIKTASYYELVAWCNSLKLETSGDKQALQQRVQNYYKIQSEKKPTKEDQRIEIQSAQNSEYFSIDEINEDYIHIRGGVSIVLTDKQTSTKHTIKAERILFNQTKSIISASGNIEYTRQQGETNEVFKGESFIFDVSNWEGILYLARGEQEKTVEETSLLFVYSGTAISRLKDDTIIIENGVITSSKNIDNPNYKITASKIWVFGPGEWAIQDALLFVGHIPTLYFPFYYYSMDEIFFNPVVGYKLREGAYFQNTIYLIGHKTRDESPLSFLPVDTGQKTQQKYVLDGLYLRPEKNTQQDTSTVPAQNPATIIKHFKLYADVYSRLGFFSGLSFDMTPTFMVKGGLGISRSIFTDVYNNKTPYYLGNEYWNSSYFFGIQTFFRYGLETKFDLKWEIIESISGQFNLFSDPYFTKDFYSRDETQDWGKIIGFELPTLATSTTTIASSQLSLNWLLNSRINFAGLINTSLFRPFEIRTLSFAFDWGSRDVPPPMSAIVAADPSRTFYYPQRIIFPNVNLLIGGSLINFTNSNEIKIKKTVTHIQDPGDGVQKPVEDEEKILSETSEEQDPFEIDKPGIRQDSIVNRAMTYYSFSLSYSLNHNFKMEHLFKHLSWQYVEDIDFSTESSISDLNGISNLNYKISILNSMWDITGGFIFQDKYKTTYTPGSGYDQTAQDRNYTGLLFTKNILTSYRPFLQYPDFSSSSVSYNVKWNYFDYYYDAPNFSYTSRLFAWERNTLQLQQINVNLVFKPEDKPNSLKTIYTIPPVLGRFYHELNFYLWFSQTIAVLEYKERMDTTWYFEPFRLTEKILFEKYFSSASVYRYDIENQIHLDIKNDINIVQYEHRKNMIYLINQKLDYDFTEQMFLISDSTLTLWDFQLSFLLKKMQPVYSIGTQKLGPEEFLPDKLSASYDFKSDNIYLWKNRIALFGNINTSLKIHFQDVINSNFKLAFQFGFKIHEFHELIFSINMYNNNIYRYIPAFVDRVNADAQLPPPAGYGINPLITPTDPITDFLKSLNFFNIEDRYNSFFKLESIGVDYKHYLGDWTFTVSYKGAFRLETLNDGTSQYNWIPSFSFSVKWLPIPEIKKEVTGDKNGLQL